MSNKWKINYFTPNSVELGEVVVTADEFSACLSISDLDGAPSLIRGKQIIETESCATWQDLVAKLIDAKTEFSVNKSPVPVMELMFRAGTIEIFTHQRVKIVFSSGNLLLSLDDEHEARIQAALSEIAAATAIIASGLGFTWKPRPDAIQHRGWGPVI